ncbi:hypothetical protein [Coleofasciculus chthonoplastes]|uniref:hypothetical protein n=1 Tax=Coleofasciculus chthonoplastes TaxID=64178 RepID=UPI0032F76FB2
MESVSISLKKDTTPIAGQWFERYHFSRILQAGYSLYSQNSYTKDFSCMAFRTHFKITQFIFSADIEGYDNQIQYLFI